MIWQLLGTLLLLNLGGILTPGPDLFLVLRLASRSRRHAIAAVLGSHLCLTGWVLLTALGAATLLGRYPWLLGWIQVAGGLWLLFMAQSLVRAGWREFSWRRRHAGVHPDIDVSSQLGSVRAAFAQGFATNLSNPKVILYFSAIMAPILPVGAPWWTVAMIVVAVVMESLVIFSTIALSVSTSTMRRKLLGAGPYIDLAAGAFFSIAGVTLLIVGGSALH